MVQCHWVYFFLLLALAIRGAFLNFIWNGSPSSETQLTALKCFESLLPWVCSNGLDRTFSFSCCLNDFRVGISSPALQHAKEGREGTVERKHIFFSLCWKNSSSNFQSHAPLAFVAAVLGQGFLVFVLEVWESWVGLPRGILQTIHVLGAKSFELRLLVCEALAVA